MKKLITLSLLPFALLPVANADIVAGDIIGIDFADASALGTASGFNEFSTYVILDTATASFSGTLKIHQVMM